MCIRSHRSSGALSARGGFDDLSARRRVRTSIITPGRGLALPFLATRHDAAIVPGSMSPPWRTARHHCGATANMSGKRGGEVRNPSSYRVRVTAKGPRVCQYTCADSVAAFLLRHGLRARRQQALPPDERGMGCRYPAQLRTSLPGDSLHCFRRSTTVGTAAPSYAAGLPPPRCSRRGHPGGVAIPAGIPGAPRRAGTIV